MSENEQTAPEPELVDVPRPPVGPHDTIPFEGEPDASNS